MFICGSSLPARKAMVSLTMIENDKDTKSSTCVISVAGLYDEIVVVNTGSKDRTSEIAREFGARVFDFVWVDDFAAARNAAFARATGDYAFWLDAAAVIDPTEREKLRALVGGLRTGAEAGDGGPRLRLDPPYGTDGPPAYVLRCSCDQEPSGDCGQTVVDHIRLFPLREDVRLTYRVAEAKRLWKSTLKEYPGDWEASAKLAG